MMKVKSVMATVKELAGSDRIRIMLAKGIIWMMLSNIAGASSAIQAYAAVSAVSSNSLSGDSIAVEGISDNSAPVISISVNEAKSSGAKKLFEIKTSDIGSGIALIQAENIKAGVRSTLVQADDLYRELSEEVNVELTITNNGSYRVYAYDGKGNAAVQRIEASGIGGYSPDKYRERMEKNAYDNDNYHKDSSYNNTVPTYENAVIFGGNGDGTDYQSANKNTSYVYKSKNNILPSAGIGMYDDWSMLRKKEKAGVARLWSEEGSDGEWTVADSGSGDELEYRTEISTLLNKRTSPFSAETSGIGDMIIEGSRESYDTGMSSKTFSRRKITGIIIIVVLVSASLIGICLFIMKKGKEPPVR
ncbi:MAG: hypothetical protein IJ827_05850 [Lachnospiraceae bacterium]|nr:hypothetical protein [Lachnospiraceae bacterium]